MAEAKLKQGRSVVRLVGKVKITERSLEDAKQNASGTWLGVNTTFGVDTGGGNVVYPRIFGGRSLSKGVLYKFGKERDANGRSEMLQIPIADRHKEEIINSVDEMSGFRRASLEKGDDGKTIEKRFLDDIDYVEYLQNNLYEDMEVVVQAQADYQLNKDGETVYRNYEISNIFLNPVEKDKEENEIFKYQKSATLTQTYLVDEYSVSEDYKKEIRTDGKTAIAVKVPQYLSQVQSPQGEYVDFKEVATLPQAIFVRAKSDEKEDIDNAIKAVDYFFKGVKADKLRMMNLVVSINEGYETKEGGEIELSKETKALIKAGWMTEEQVKAQQVVTRGTRVSELVFFNVHTSLTNSEGEKTYVDNDTYTASALNMPNFDSDDNDDDNIASTLPPIIDEDEEIAELDMDDLFAD